MGIALAIQLLFFTKENESERCEYSLELHFLEFFESGIYLPVSSVQINVIANKQRVLINRTGGGGS